MRYALMAVRAPDVALLNLCRYRGYPKTMPDKTRHVCPLFPPDVVELKHHWVGFAAIDTRVEQKIAQDVRFTSTNCLLPTHRNGHFPARFMRPI